MLEIKWKKKLKLNWAMYYSVVANLYKFYYSLGLNIFMVMFQPLNNFHCFVSFFYFPAILSIIWEIGEVKLGLWYRITDIAYNWRDFFCFNLDSTDCPIGGRKNNTAIRWRIAQFDSIRNTSRAFHQLPAWIYVILLMTDHRVAILSSFSLSTLSPPTLE